MLAGPASFEGSRGDPVPCLFQLREGAACIPWPEAPSSHHSNLLLPSSHLFVLTLLPPLLKTFYLIASAKWYKVTESQARGVGRGYLWGPTQPGGGPRGPGQGSAVQTNGNWVKNLHHPFRAPWSPQAWFWETRSLVNTKGM